MFRRSLPLSLMLPLIGLLVILMLAISFDLWAKQHLPPMRALSAGLVGLVAAWLIVSVYFQIRRRVLTPLRELRRKLQRARYDQLETVPPSPAGDEIADVIDGYNRMVAALTNERADRARLEQERALQSQLAALGLQSDGLVHELASPLSALSTLSKLAAEGDPEALKTIAREIPALAERLRRFMNHFRNRQVTVRPLMLDRIVQERLGILQRGEISCEQKLSENIPVLSDQVLLSEILDNLLNNALRHAKSKVSVECGLEAGSAWLIVTDDGPGVSSKHAEKLFRPFFTTAAGGHGLGLYISRLWAVALGGRLDLDAASHPTLGGASFRLTLPVH
ncbi:HAMP domain-containing histidine kinase [bacterium]|nr:HAMP domain-containing histidine kinase [bacterium]